jgi:hypothetical protein
LLTVVGLAATASVCLRAIERCADSQGRESRVGMDTA